MSNSGLPTSDRPLLTEIVISEFPSFRRENGGYVGFLAMHAPVVRTRGMSQATVASKIVSGRLRNRN
ncbi:hypothetical protein L218DRAFT_967479 [Marasmius fiardii PR-910]|nr:hypothetical protein L218DRAFT_967479 [Marasmius fiardii PR-910]